MAGEAEQLGEFIDKHLASTARASLVDVIAHFDHQNHSLPSTWRLNKALAELAAPVALSADGLYLEKSNQTNVVQLSDSEMSRIIEAYTKAIRAH